MSLDRHKIKAFWQQRAADRLGEDSRRITNLEEDERLQGLKVEQERRRVFELLPLAAEDRVLDLASGVGAWSLPLAARCQQVVGVEYLPEMVETARANAARRGLNNVDFVCNDVLNYEPDRHFDVVFISGLLLYLDDDAAARLVRTVAQCTAGGARIFLREPVGLQGRYEIVDRYSEALKAKYSALYRSREEILALFATIGCRLTVDGDMFAPDSPLNKWQETRLRVFLFARESLS